MRTTKSERRRVSASGIATMLLTASLAIAKTYDIVCDTISLGTAVSGQTTPVFPADEEPKTGQEDRMKVSLVLSADGETIDRVILN